MFKTLFSQVILLFCGFHAGLRFKEMDYATVKWFDVGAGRTSLIHIQNMPEKNFYIKDQEDRTVPMSDEFKSFLTDFLPITSFNHQDEVVGAG